jgi:hypothetical protein
MGIMAFSSAEESQQQAALQQQQQQQQQQDQQHLQQQQVPTQPQPQQTEYQDLTPEEKVRRDRVRAAARERQRKHRQLVKQRRMRDLGLEMGNEMMQGMEEVHYRATPDQYHSVIPPELQQLPPPHPQLEAPFPHGAPMGGQTFASTLLLSFSCAPLLKQHLLRTLNMSNEELTSLEPIIADAWDRWDHSVGNLFINALMNYLFCIIQRRMHYAEHVAKNGGQPPGMPAPYPVDLTQHESQSAPPAPFPHPNGPGPADPNQAAATNEFRTRFHRSIVGPTPFAAFTENQTASTTTPSSTSGSTQENTIDPHLATNASSSAANGTKGEPVSVST